MDTPLYDFLVNYAGSGTVRAHMPGHKGRSLLPELSALYSFDITEINGADSLFEADGIIRRSEENMSALYGTADTFYSAGGSTLCIQAMLAAMKLEGRTVIAVRNVHRAFLNAAALLDLDVKWLMPRWSGGILSGEISLADAEELLRSTPSPCLYVTSPDYTGHMADIRSLSQLCRKYEAPLIVDNAHGAHLRFMQEDMHPISLGADMCCDSAHKMLPALTGAAMLHTSDAHYAGMLRQCMSMFASTSPSYLIMASIDLCCGYLEGEIRRDICRVIPMINALKQRFADQLCFVDGDPFHITISAAESGLDGNELAQLLRENGAECEYSDSDLVILLMSPMTAEADISALSAALENALSAAVSGAVRDTRFTMELPRKAMSIREAFFAPCETIPVGEAVGRICASVKVPCPPAVPIAASGEVIDRSCVELFRRYGIPDVIVVKQQIQ